MAIKSSTHAGGPISLQARASDPHPQHALFPLFPLFSIDEEPAGRPDPRGRWQGLSGPRAAQQAGDDLVSCVMRCREIYGTTLPRPPLTPPRAALRRLSFGADVLYKKARDPERPWAERALYGALLAPTLLSAPLLGPLAGGSLLTTRAHFEAEDKLSFDDRHFRHDVRRAVRRELTLLDQKLSHAPPLGAAINAELEGFIRFFLRPEMAELKLRDPLQPVRRLVEGSFSTQAAAT